MVNALGLVFWEHSLNRGDHKINARGGDSLLIIVCISEGLRSINIKERLGRNIRSGSTTNETKVRHSSCL